ncbi:MAG TPA: type II toxin-antitoxin system VapC family toxin [Anaerolineales bacterium]|nr:type II toxin-antitoxin system VapC family toxin [Anaerolineales bacterium]HND47040.1 type II toxin-antitoxin system VapC family toxin [Anaerolineales bacterium]
MNLYIDTSAIIKLFIQESYSDEIRSLVEVADLVATGLITRAETAAGINRLTRMGVLDQESCEIALGNFRKDWGEYHRIQVTEQIVIRADFLTGQYSLRGYDAIHLACALTWSELLGAPVSLATFDKELYAAAKKSGLEVFP